MNMELSRFYHSSFQSPQGAVVLESSFGQAHNSRSRTSDERHVPELLLLANIRNPPLRCVRWAVVGTSIATSMSDPLSAERPPAQNWHQTAVGSAWLRWRAHRK